MCLLSVQDRFHTRDGSLHLGGHAGMERFGADMDGVEKAQRSVEGQACMRTQDAVWQGEYPVLNGPGFATQPEVRSSQLHQGDGQEIIRRCQRVRNGLAPFALLLIPACCPSVQERYQLWLRGVQLSAQGLAKQIMIAVPLPLL